MKNYEIIASKEIVARFTMDYATYKMKFECLNEMVEWIINEHPELKDVPNRANFPKDSIVIEFYSVGNLVIEEK